MYTRVPVILPRKLQASDLFAFLIIALLLWGTVATAERWGGELHPKVTIDLSLQALPIYTIFSLFRGLIAYAISLMVTLIIGYVAAKNRTLEKIILPLLDVGQSMPVLGFLPGLVLGLIAVFPKTNIGLELACILMIFTSQVWNMAFGYYASLRSIPDSFHDVSAMFGLSRMRRLLRVELPFSGTTLAWNSMISMAGGWFFLTVCESFRLGNQDFRLPGLGAYMTTAIELGDTRAIVAGVVAMLAIIVVIDFLVWRPIIAWTARLRTEDQQGELARIPFTALLLKDSHVVQRIMDLLKMVIGHLQRSVIWIRGVQAAPKAASRYQRGRWYRFQKSIIWKRTKVAFIAGCLVPIGFWVVGRVVLLIEPLQARDWVLILGGTTGSLLRVAGVLVLASAWTVPLGIWIGLSPRLTRFFQPVIQIVASFPAPMIYPLVLTVFYWLKIPFAFGSCLLLAVGAQWYVLFNVLAGAAVISSEYRDTFISLGLKRRDLWLKIYIPLIFPSLITGWVTAAGGAWNATIVAEYIQYKGHVVSTLGLGALISEATANGNFAMLAGCLLAMVTTVVVLNRTFWNWLYAKAQQRYRLEA